MVVAVSAAEAEAEAEAVSVVVEVEAAEAEAEAAAGSILRLFTGTTSFAFSGKGDAAMTLPVLWRFRSCFYLLNKRKNSVFCSRD